MVNMPTFKNKDELFVYLQKNISESLQDNIANEARDTLVEHATNDAIGQYFPKVYIRRGSGGIEDPNNVKTEMIDENTLSVRNETPPSPALFSDANEDKSELTRLSRWISEGIYNPFGVEDGLWNKPKPFVKNARDDLEKSKRHVDALKKGLIARGIDIK